MSASGEAGVVPPFPPEYRCSGILLHVTSLPSPYGIGDLGPSAFSWVDRLADSGQGWWQALPVGPTGYGNSPYQSLSSFAGNGLLISPQYLISDGLLNASDCALHFPSDLVDYDSVIPFKQKLLDKAWIKFNAGERRDLQLAYQEFCAANESWLEDYALFRALKNRFGGSYYLEWPEEFVQRKPAALAQARSELAHEIDRYRLEQFLLLRQADQLKEYAHAKGVSLIGDLPFFVSPDSSDVWANPEFFLLDERRRPQFVAAVPPDYFSNDGQLWGNPVYNWDALRSTGYRWCIDRVRALLNHVDVIRLDHFRGFAAAWHVPAGAKTARSGQWVAGPGATFFETIQRELGHLSFIAEDLGTITSEVASLRDQFQVPGTRILQLPKPQKEIVWSYLERHLVNSEEAAPALIELAWSSVAALTIAPLQDVFALGAESRMNVPGRADGNWRWRFNEKMVPANAFKWLHDLTNRAKRSASAMSKFQTVRTKAPHFYEVQES
jgi:4-alpha-glucanotransferase